MPSKIKYFVDSKTLQFIVQYLNLPYIVLSGFELKILKSKFQLPNKICFISFKESP